MSSSVPSIDLTLDDSDVAGDRPVLSDLQDPTRHNFLPDAPQPSTRLPGLYSAAHHSLTLEKRDSWLPALRDGRSGVHTATPGSFPHPHEETHAKFTRTDGEVKASDLGAVNERLFVNPHHHQLDNSLSKRRRLQELDRPHIPNGENELLTDSLNFSPHAENAIPEANNDEYATISTAEQAGQKPPTLKGDFANHKLEQNGSETSEDPKELQTNITTTLEHTPTPPPVLGNGNDTPIIILSDDDDDDYDVMNTANLRDGQKQTLTGADAAASVDHFRAIHDRNLEIKNQKHEEFTTMKTTCRDTKTILQGKLQKRDALIQQTTSRLRVLLAEGHASGSAPSTSQLQEELWKLEERREQTRARLRKLEDKERASGDEYSAFLSKHGPKLQKSHLDLQNALSNKLHITMVEKRANLTEEKSSIDHLFRTGAIDAIEMKRRKAEIDKSLNETHSTLTAPQSTGSDQKSEIFFRSLEVARNLISKNTVRSSENKKLMGHFLAVVEQFRRACDRGERYSPKIKFQVENAITELYRHGVKMPAVSKYLKSLAFIVDPMEYDLVHGAKGDDFKNLAGSDLETEADILELAKFQNNQQGPNSLQLSNIYNIQDNDSLQELLEGLKTTEAEVEGEELTPPELTVNLMKHQRQGLRWLLQVEQSSKRGGLLADDMGLGKTVQAIALMIANRSKDAKCKTNLIVAPVAVLRVWQAEIKTKVNKAAGMKVIIFGGNNGAKVENYRSLLRHDVVLVSYQTLASELKKHWPARLTQDAEELKIMADVPEIKAMNALKSRNEYWSPFYCDDSQFYRIILDEAQNIKNKKTQSSKACCAIGATYRWALSGTPMQNSVMELYSLIRFLRISPYNREQRFKLDIGNPLGKASNDYDSFDRKQAIKKVQVLLRAIMLRRTKDSEIDGKPILELPEKTISCDEKTLVGSELDFYTDLELKNKKKAEKLMAKQSKGNYSNILTLLLRLRQACCHSELVILGEHKSETSKVANGKNFDNDWLRLFELARGMPGIGHAAVAEGLENMSCPYCMEQMELDSTVVTTPCGHMMCEGCAEQYFEEARIQNGARKIVNSGYAVPCLVCNKFIDDNEVVTYKLYDQAINQNLTVQGLREEYNAEMRAQKDRLKNGYKINYDTLQPSPKISQCLEIFRQVISSSDNEKVLVFSQFTTFFDLLQYFIRKELNVHHLRYDGSMDAQARAATIEEFYKNPQRRILLISMKAGNAGLTLTCANHVILVDPFWNPYVEEQAMDRCYRISQTKNVKIHKLLVKNSVEDRILELQKKKRELVESAMNPDKIQEVNRLGRRELGFLFGLNNLE
ncbi:LADA_0A04126g1_1 [Lachancea dasiensis]|uniref:LADA_0A04126g1_1 n=1 Tax=Lachancea dasiensis TaxID=1072105 RepID=A0A1G4INE4_9SACH|nr:LADA_0A04126g1_1 [Lachancea dasiensis]